METVKVQIELPTLEGYEYTGEFRLPKMGEWYLCHASGPMFAQVDFELYSFPILRKVWQEPAGIFKPGWIAKDKTGEWYWFERIPRLRDGVWLFGGHHHELAGLNIDFPQCDYKDSVREVGK